METPVKAVIADLERQIEHCLRQETHHAEREVFHREQRTVLAADAKTLQERLEAFRAAAEAAGEWLGRHAPPEPEWEPEPEPKEEPVEPELPRDFRGRLRQSDLVEMIVREKPPQETFGPSDVVQELRARFGSKLRNPLDARSVSAKLRRLAAEGTVVTVRKGVAYHEAQYRRA